MRATGSLDTRRSKIPEICGSAAGDKSYYMRGTFTHANPDFLKDIEDNARLSALKS